MIIYLDLSAPKPKLTDIPKLDRAADFLRRHVLPGQFRDEVIEYLNEIAVEIERSIK